MTCPKCAAPLLGAPPLCPCCGNPILEADRTFQLSFEGDTVEFFGWLVLSLLSAIVVIPLAWVLAAMGRWFCRNLRLDGPTTVAFLGTGPEILGWIACTAILSLPSWFMRGTKDGVPLLVMVGIISFLLRMLLDLSILRWIARKLELSSGPPLHFDGSYTGYLGYHLLIAISFITIIGWAWVIASFYGWMAENTRGERIAFRCEVSGWEVLWRTVVLAVGSILIVTIPWLLMWYARWIVSCISLTRGATPLEPEWA